MYFRVPAPTSFSGLALTPPPKGKAAHGSHSLFFPTEARAKWRRGGDWLLGSESQIHFPKLPWETQEGWCPYQGLRPLDKLGLRPGEGPYNRTPWEVQPQGRENPHSPWWEAGVLGSGMPEGATERQQGELPSQQPRICATSLCFYLFLHSECLGSTLWAEHG